MKNTRTSESHPIRVDWLPDHVLGLPGRLGMTFAPGKKDLNRAEPWDRDLEADLRCLRERHAADVLVSLIEEDERGRLQIVELPQRARAHGIEFLVHSIVDGAVPTDLTAFQELLKQVVSRLEGGRRVVVHCRGGLGRAGLVATAVLIQCGRKAAESMALVRRARAHTIENSTQENFLERLATNVAQERRAGLTAAAASSANAGATQPAPWSLQAWLDGNDGCRAAVAAGAGLTQSQVGAMLSRIENEVAAHPTRCFAFDEAGKATLQTSEKTFAAGRFETPSLGELKARLTARRAAAGPVRLSVILGRDDLTDIGTLQASSDGQALFQVASQFNCLESPGPHICQIRNYPGDHTQGPRASVSAFPGTFLRHYQAPDGRGGRFTQGVGGEIDLLADALGPGIARVEHGYLRVEGVPDAKRALAAMRERFDHVRIGLHDDVEVALGRDWGGPVTGARRIAQVFTAAMALGYSRQTATAQHMSLAQEILRAGFFGTLLGATVLGKRRAVLTMIGAGAFGNPAEMVWEAMLWAVDQLATLGSPGLDVVVNGFDLEKKVPLKSILPAVRKREGVVVRVEDGVVAEVG